MERQTSDTTAIADRRPAARAAARQPGAPAVDGGRAARTAARPAPADRLGELLRAAVVARLPAAHAAVTAGAVGAPLLQRSGDERWALPAVTKYRKTLDAHSRWGPGALHHHISRETWASLAEAHAASSRARDKEVQKAAQAFRTLVAKLIEALYDDLEIDNPKKAIHGISFETMLANLPLNLHYGPRIVINDPGSGFDPSTVPRDTGGRVTEPVSDALLALETYFRAAIDELDDDEVLSARHWNDMTELLDEANAIYRERPGGIMEENYHEQWVQGAGDAWLKKGELSYYGAAHAGTRFGVPAPMTSQAANPERYRKVTLRCQDGDLWVMLGATSRSVTHFCNRHTYAHFDATQIKGVNIFWPVGTDRAGVQAEVERALGLVWDYIDAEIGDPTTRDGYEIIDQIAELIGPDGLKRVFDDLYVRVFVRDQKWRSRNVQLSLELDMVAPTGPGYEAYSRDTLEEVLL